MHSQACAETWVEAMSHRQRWQGHGSAGQAWLTHPGLWLGYHEEAERWHRMSSGQQGAEATHSTGRSAGSRAQTVLSDTGRGSCYCCVEDRPWGLTRKQRHQLRWMQAGDSEEGGDLPHDLSKLTQCEHSSGKNTRNSAEALCSSHQEKGLTS